MMLPDVMDGTPPGLPVHDLTPRDAPRTRRHAERGFALIETFLVVALLGMALLWHAASSLGGYNLMRSEASHSQALETLRHFIERLRTDPEWETLYPRLAALAGAPLSGTGHPPEVYYDDYEAPLALGRVRILVEVPRVAAVDAMPSDPLVLREDVTADRFGLPHDLNGDGSIDAASHDDDYRALPVIVHFHWQAPGESPQVLRVATWLRGAR